MKRILPLITVLIVLSISTFALSLSTFAESGESGECTWSLDGTTATVSGAGRMEELPIFADGNNDIEKIIIDEGVTYVSGGSFDGCTAVREVYISKTVSEIGDEFFSSFDSLERIDVDPESPYFCSVDGVLYSKDMTRIVKYPSASFAQTFELPETVTAIGYKAFCGAFALEYVDLPEGITYIGENAFFGTPLYNNANNRDFYGALYIGKYLIVLTDFEGTEYSVKEGTVTVANGAFGYLATASLETVVFPDGLEYLGDACFIGCKSLKAVSLPASIKAIGEYAFDQCPSLSQVYFRGESSENAVIGKGNGLLTDAEWFFNSCYISAEHLFVGFEEVKKADCVESGLKRTTCSLCSYVDEVTVEPLGHACTQWEVSLAPTCHSVGEEKSACRVCGEITTREVAMVEHNYGEWETLALPTCTADGSQKRICTVCSVEDSVVLEKIEHSFGIFTVTVEPTVNTEGVETAECSICGTVKSRVVDKLEPQSSGKLLPSATKTENIIVIVSAVIVGVSVVVAGGIVTVTVVLIRRKKKKK